jgi:hypothetical protein
MRLAVCELPDGLTLSSPEWMQLVERLEREKPDLLVLNEMPMAFTVWRNVGTLRS